MTFQNKDDLAIQKDTAAQLAALWSCEIRTFGANDPVDWYGLRDGRTVFVAEFKNRTNTKDHYSTVYLSMRTWLALSLASVGLGVEAYYVVRFTDAVCWIDLANVDPRRHTFGGRTDRGVDNDLEPVIHVSVATMDTAAIESEPTE